MRLILDTFKRLRGLFLLQFTLLMSAGFTLWRTGASSYVYPDTDPNTYPFFCNDDYVWAQWCFNKVELLPGSYIYFLYEELILLGLCAYILHKSIKADDFVVAHAMFLAIQAVDVIDYLIAYQKTWMHLGPFTLTLFNEELIIGPYPLSWNIMKVVIFSIVIVNEALTLLEGKLYAGK